MHFFLHPSTFIGIRETANIHTYTDKHGDAALISPFLNCTSKKKISKSRRQPFIKYVYNCTITCHTFHIMPSLKNVLYSVCSY